MTTYQDPSFWIDISERLDYPFANLQCIHAAVGPGVIRGVVVVCYENDDLATLVCQTNDLARTLERNDMDRPIRALSATDTRSPASRYPGVSSETRLSKGTEVEGGKELIVVLRNRLDIAEAENTRNRDLKKRLAQADQLT